MKSLTPGPLRALAIAALLFLLAPALSAQNLTETTGIVRIQAEEPTLNTGRSIGGIPFSWTASTGLSGFTGTGFMEAEPNDGTSISSGWTTTSPELQYSVTFANAGTYYVWMRVFAETAENASVHIGLNGASPAAATLTASQFNTWKWVNTGSGSATPVTVTVPAAGTYTLNVWMGDAGFRFDRILLTRNPNYTPEFSADFWRQQNIYQIITDRFFNGNPSNDNFYGWAEPNIGNKTHGGDFSGIEKKLDYIKALGATAIWISPVVKNGAGDFDYHGYAGTDFYNTDPRFGSMSDLQRLVAEAHKRGILVVNDVVVNHASTWVDSGDAGWGTTFKYPPDGYNLRYNSGGRTFAPPFDPASLQAAFGNTNLVNIFNNNGGTQNWSDATQVELGELVSLDDFRTQSTYVRDRMAEIYTWWIQQAGFDAFRIDTVKHVEMGFWDNWSPRIRAAAAAADKPNFFQFGEVYDGSDAKCGSYTGTKTTAPFKMESVVDYPLYYQVGSVFATATGATKQIEDRYNNLNTWNYDQSALNSLVTFIDNHDQNRFLNAGGGTARLQVALAFLYTSRGIPCLYYGTEQDFDGGADPWNREDMFDGQFEGGPSTGDNFNMASPRFKLVAKLNNLRRLYPSLRTGIHWNQWNNASGPGLLAYSRRLGGEEAYVVLNTASSQQTIGYRPTIHPPGTVVVNLFNPGEKLTVVNGAGGWEIPSFTAQPNSYAIFVAESQVKALDPVVESISPAHDASSVPVGSAITVSFSKPMNTLATQAAFSTTPATAGSFVWSANNTVVTYTAAGLTGNTLYSVRISDAATDSTGMALLGAFESRFTTAASSGASKPAVASSTASVTGDNSATLSSSINPNGAATTLFFEYGPTSAYGSATANQSLSSGTSFVTRTASLTGLVPGTTYSYRVVATNSAGTTYGPDGTFTTTLTIPDTTAITSPASGVTTTAAVLNGIVNPNGNPTTAYFQYGVQADQLTNNSTIQNLGSGSQAQTLSLPLGGLQPDTVYYYRVVAANPTKTIQGATLSFTTLPVKPTLADASAENVLPGSATLSTTVNPNGSDSTVWFEYGPDTDYGFTTAVQNVPGSGGAAVPVNAPLANLAPGQTYHFRAVASNAFGTTFGADRTFATGFPPPTVETGNASGVSSTTANLTASINPNGPETTYWFEYGTSPALGLSTMAGASDDAEGYSSLGYTSTSSNAYTSQNGGDGFAAFRTYARTSSSRGGIRLVTASSAGGTAGRQIDGANSISIFAGTSTSSGRASCRRALDTPRQSGTVSFSVRFDVANTKAFVGVNLKSADGSSFGANELLSIGIMPASGQVGGNTAVVVTDKSGQRNLDLGSEIRGQVLDVRIDFDCVAGTHVCSVKFRDASAFTKLQGDLKLSGATVRLGWLGFINGSNTGSSAQNLILDNLVVASAASLGAGTTPVSVSSPLSGLAADTTYYYRAVASNSAGQSTGTTTTFFTGENTAPTISDIADQTIAEDSSTGAIAFVIGDSQTAAGSLSLIAASDNQTLVPDSNIVFGGSGANRTLTVTPAPNRSGNTTITVNVGDGGLDASRSFVLRVTPVNDAPTVGRIPNQSLTEDTPSTPLPFDIGDLETPAASLVVTGSSNNQSLIPDSNLAFGGAGANRTLTVTPAANQTGVATLAISVSDGNLTTTSTFDVSVGATNDPPAIADLQNLTIEEDSSAVVVDLAVSDADSDPGQLVVSATSSNTALVPASNLLLAGGGANRTLSLAPAPNQYGNSTITVSASDGFASSSKSFLLSVTEVNDPPAIGSIPDQKTNAGVAVGPIGFTVGDVESAAASLTVTASSGNPSLVPAANIVLGGSGASRTVTVMPAGNLGGNATITLTVGDGLTSASSQFVLSVNSAPTISDIPDQSAFAGFPTAPVPFTIGDAETAADSLVVAVGSDNSNLLPQAGIVLEGTSADRALILTPSPGQSGNANITVTVGDGSANSSTTFALAVAAAPDISIEKSNGADSSGDAAYADGSFPGKNGGFGFGNWTLSTVGFGGSYIGASGLSARSLAIYAGGEAGNNATAVRPFAPAMEVGETFQVRLGYTGVAAGGEIGLRLRSGGSDRLTLRFVGGGSEWMLNDGGSDFGTGISWAGGNPGTTLNVSLTRNADNGYSIQITSGAQSYTGTNYTASSGVMSIDSVEFFSTAQGGGENLGFDQLERSVPLGGSLDFGSRDVGTTGPAVALAVRNTGSGPLEGLALTWSGSNAPDFSVDTPAATTLPPGASTTLSATFTPSAAGARSASLFVASNDPDENPLVIALAGTGLGGAPSISPIADQTIDEDAQAGPVSFVIGDSGTGLETLAVNATSDNQALVPDTGILLEGSGANRSITVTPSPNQSGNATITIVAGYGPWSSSRTFVVTVTPVNDPPTLDPIPDQSTPEGTPLAAIPLVIGDIESSPESLVLTATSANPSFVPDANLVFGGSGSNRTLSITPASAGPGASAITVTVDDGSSTANRTFQFTVEPFNQAPTISAIADQSLFENTASDALAFVIGDAETDADSLTLVAQSDNPTLVPDSNIVLAGTGADRTVTVTPAANLTGDAVITLAVGDGQSTTRTTFTVSVTAPPDISLDESTAWDSSNLSAYDSGTFAGLNGGRGFEPWSGNTTGSGGFYIGPVGSPESAPRSFAIYAGGGNGNSSEAVRTFGSSMMIGETLGARLAYTGVDADGEIGMEFRSAGGARLVLKFVGGSAEWVLNNGGQDFGTGLPWNGGLPLEVLFRRNEGSGYSIWIDNGVQRFEGIDHTGNSGEMAIDSVRFFSTAQGPGQHLGFDRLERSLALPMPLTTVFGNARVRNPGPTRFYRIRNTGAGILSALALSKTGDSPGDFMIGSPDADTLQPGASTYFSATFAPAARGNRTASILVASNDPDENPVAIALAGTGLNEAPTISAIEDQTRATGPIAFQVADFETPADSLAVSAQSGNPALVPDANITLGGSGANRTISILPAANQSGSATITVTVDDGDLSASESFLFTVAGGGFADWSVLASLPADRRGATDTNGPLNLPNLLAYAMGLDPLTASAADLPSLKSIDSSNGKATISYRRSKNAPGVAIDILGAASLQGGAWEPQAAQIQKVTDFPDHEWIEAEVTVPAGDRYFLRVRAITD